MNKVIVFIVHDRHTDDVIKVFPFSDENVEKVKTLCKEEYPEGTPLNYEGDFDFGYDDTAHAYLKVIEMSNI